LGSPWPLEDDANSSSAIYFGAVHPHPAFRVLLNDQGEVVSSVADLALIHLEGPVAEAISPVSMAGAEVQPPVAGDSRFLVRQPSGHTYKGDSGGPCLREASGQSLLVGISSRNLGRGAACMSIHDYREWVRSELKHPVEGKVP
jgi:hypothetical protein